MADGCPNPGEICPPAKRIRPSMEVAAGPPVAKLSFTFKPPNSESHVDKNIKVQDVPLCRVQSISSDVSMGAEEMDVDI